jgi:uncharacterized protein YkwD
MLAATALVGALALVLTVDANAATTTCASGSMAAVGAPAMDVGRAVRCLVNQQRVEHGLKPLRPSRELRLAAEAHGGDMVSHRFFAHVSPIGGAITDRARRSGYISGRSDYTLGEDIAWGEGELSSPQAIVTAWMNSPGHRAVILEPGFRDVGVGVTSGVPLESRLGGATFVLDVGSR